MSTQSQVTGLEILLVEDNRGDVHLILDVLRRSAVAHHVSVVEDGAQALDFVHRRGNYAQSPRPDLILLDLNLPRQSGREVLAELKASLDLRLIPVVMFSSSDAERDALECYALHANCYVIKPVELHAFVSAVQAIESFWCKTARLPTAAGRLR